MDYTARINQTKMALEKAKADKIRAEQNKVNLEKRKGEIEAEITGLGVDPANIDTAIQALDTEISSDLLTVEGMIPAQYR